MTPRRPHTAALCLTALCLCWMLCLPSCSTTRRIDDDEQLYTGFKGVQIVPDSLGFPGEVHDVLTEAADAEANKKTLYLLPIGLWAYNNLNDSTWLYRKLAQTPVLVSDVRPGLRVKMLDQILDNNGYFSGTSSYELVSPKSNPKKAAIRYVVRPGRPYAIDSLIMLPDSGHLCHSIDSAARRDPYLGRVPGVRFSMDSLSDARIRLARGMRNRGYYYFRPEYIEYLADTLQRPGSVVLKMDLASNVPAFALRRYITGEVTVHADRQYGFGRRDTFHLPRVTLIQQMPSRLRHSVFEDNVSFRPGRFISERAVNNTQSYLSRLGIFNSININAIPDTASAVPRVNIDITTTFDQPLEAQLEVNASSKSNSYIGPGLNFSVTNHNVFGGGEQFTVKLTGSYEWQTGKGSNSVFNSYEFGINSSLAFPRMLAPGFIPRRRRQLNWTRLTLGADLLNRPHFFKLAQFDMGITYDWQSGRYLSQSFTPFKLTYTKLMHTTEVFDSLMAANPAVAQSFQSRFIPQMSYSFVYDRPYGPDNRFNLQVSLTEAGNGFWALYEAFGAKGEKRLFGTPFSQFVKGQAQVVWSRRVGRSNWLVSRVVVGAAHAYGNASQVPYSEQFYCGGANSVRAFTVRSIGPGSYHDPTAKSDDYFDQTGTFKFEANTELRFPLMGPLNGAVFIDAGNVWLLDHDPLRPGGTLQASTFLKELALGTGVGLRVDIGMLVLRGDLGIGIHAPYYTGKRGYYNMTSFGNSLAFHLAIGYPF